MISQRNKSPEVEVCVLDRNTKSEFNSSFRTVEDIDPQLYPTVMASQRVEPRRFHSDAEYAMYVLEHFGYAPKVFCHAEKNDHLDPFEVKSNRWNWFVQPATPEDIPDIPPHLIQALGIVKKYNVPVRCIALATPLPKEYTGDVIRAELHKEAKAIGETIKFSVLLLASTMRSIESHAVSFAESLPLHDLPDPVLLIRLSNTWIEIGRW